MIKVLFFAQLREQLGCASLDVKSGPGVTDLNSLHNQLAARQEGQWRAILEQDNIVRAVNQVAVFDNVTLNDGDEVAFYPPVTGG